MAFRPGYKPKPAPFNVTFWGRNLRVLNEDLFQRVATQSGNPLDGHVKLDVNLLDETTKAELMAALPLMGKMAAPGSMREHEERNKAIQDETARLGQIAARQKALKDSGDQQLAAYQKQQGLLDSKKNADILREAILRRDRGVFCATSVRNQVEAERANLEWGKVAPPAAAPAPAVEPTITLSDGSKQLPLGTVPNRSHTITQLKDLDARQRAAKSKHPGVFGTRF